MSYQSDTIKSQLQNEVDQWVKNRPVSHWGLSRLTRPLSIEFYQTWLQKGYHSDMKYLEEHLPMKNNPQLLNSTLRSALVFAFPYLPHPEKQDFPLKELRIAAYAQGQDYHFWIKKHLRELIEDLQTKFPDESFQLFTDSGPVLERDLAYRASLGWVGKNTCLIDRQHGSFFLIGEVMTSLDLQIEPELVQNFCGQCTACMDICPTQALTAPKTLDANLCLSYWNIESRSIPSEGIRRQMGDWFFGCDLCQSVCPWNQKAFRGKLTLETSCPRPERNRQDLIEELRFILTSSGKALGRAFAGTALQRAGPFGLKRNAMIVAANLNITELTQEIQSFTEHEKLGELAQWALKELKTQTL